MKSSVAATRIGRTLARLGELSQRASEPPNVLPGDKRESHSRDEIYRILASRDRAWSVDEICAETGLHPNTVRVHLDILQAGGVVSREPGQRVGRGRPPWMYRVVESDLMAERRALASDLVEQLGQADSPELAAIAARKWADQANQAHLALVAQSPDEVVVEAGRSLAELGFTVTVNPVGDRIDLTGCPYADLVREHPVICDIHAAFLNQLFASSDSEVAMDHLDVWPRPGVCSVHLHRDDVQPARVIHGPDVPAPDPSKLHGRSAS